MVDMADIDLFYLYHYLRLFGELSMVSYENKINSILFLDHNKSIYVFIFVFVFELSKSNV